MNRGKQEKREIKARRGFRVSRNGGYAETRDEKKSKLLERMREKEAARRERA